MQKKKSWNIAQNSIAKCNHKDLFHMYEMWYMGTMW